MQKSCFSYPVEFVKDAFGESPVLADTLKKVTGSDEPKVLIVADLNVVQRTEGLGAKIGRYVQAHGIVLADSPVVFAGGEKAKADSLQSAFKVVASILSSKLGRDGVVLALGGGTILDVAGYAAAQVRGGVKLVRMPTTPAAMMDGAYADYAAVDSATVKDALRVASVPAAVVIDAAFASSVLDGVWRGGMGEAVRVAMALDAALMKKLVKLQAAYRDRDPAALEEVVEAVYAVRAKKGGTDFAQWGALRLESLSGYKLPHGYAVAIAVRLDLEYAVATGLLKQTDRDVAVRVLQECGALDGVAHSVHLLGQAENLLLGLDGWFLSSNADGIVLPTAIGKSKLVEELDRSVFAKVAKGMISDGASA